MPRSKAKKVEVSYTRSCVVLNNDEDIARATESIAEWVHEDDHKDLVRDMCVVHPNRKKGLRKGVSRGA